MSLTNVSSDARLILIVCSVCMEKLLSHLQLKCGVSKIPLRHLRSTPPRSAPFTSPSVPINLLHPSWNSVGASGTRNSIASRPRLSKKLCIAQLYLEFIQAFPCHLHVTNAILHNVHYAQLDNNILNMHSRHAIIKFIWIGLISPPMRTGKSVAPFFGWWLTVAVSQVG